MKKIILDDEEKDILESYERGEWVPVKNAKKEIKNAKAITMKNGKPATQGVCPSCGTKMFRIGKA